LEIYYAIFKNYKPIRMGWDTFTKREFSEWRARLRKKGMLLVKLSESEFKRFEMEWKKPPVCKNLTYRAVKYDYTVDVM